MKDTGIGIKEEDKKDLFSLFGKLNDSLHINKQGVGLGLMISKKICEHLGGTITAESILDTGTTFTF